MRSRDLLLAGLGVAAAVALRDRMARLVTSLTGTWVGRPR